MHVFLKLGKFVVRRRKSTLAVFILIICLGGGIGSLAISKLDSGGYSDPKSQSAQVTKYLNTHFHTKDPGVVLVVDSQTNVSDPAVTASALKLQKLIAAEPGISQTLSYWSTGGAPTMKSADSKAAFLFIYTTKTDFASVSDVGKNIQAKYDGKFEGLTVYASGGGVITHAINTKISKDLALAEAISIPLTFLLLVFVFGALVASAMPLVVGISAILGAFFIIFLLTLFTSVSIYALNLITGLGLGLGIDYALLIVNRFREELHAGKSVEESVAITVSTAGKRVSLALHFDVFHGVSLFPFSAPTLCSTVYACRWGTGGHAVCLET